MKVFSLNPICPKCGGTFITSEYVKKHYSGDKSDCGEKSEHLHRTCQTCGYGWVEKTMDDSK
jgi:ribosomal protein S27AE